VKRLGASIVSDSAIFVSKSLLQTRRLCRGAKYLQMNATTMYVISPKLPSRWQFYLHRSSTVINKRLNVSNWPKNFLWILTFS
jgi:hypothetical protein